MHGHYNFGSAACQENKIETIWLIHALWESKTVLAGGIVDIWLGEGAVEHAVRAEKAYDQDAIYGTVRGSVFLMASRIPFFISIQV